MCGDYRQRSAMWAEQVEQLRKRHPEWWVWHSNNVGFWGFYASRRDETSPKLQAGSPDGLSEAIAEHDAGMGKQKEAGTTPLTFR